MIATRPHEISLIANIATGFGLAMILGVGNVAFDDHPGEQRCCDQTQTATIDPVIFRLQRAPLAGAPDIVR